MLTCGNDSSILLKRGTRYFLNQKVAEVIVCLKTTLLKSCAPRSLPEYEEECFYRDIPTLICAPLTSQYLCASRIQPHLKLALVSLCDAADCLDFPHNLSFILATLFYQTLRVSFIWLKVGLRNLNLCTKISHRKPSPQSKGEKIFQECGSLILKQTSKITAWIAFWRWQFLSIKYSETLEWSGLINYK